MKNRFCELCRFATMPRGDRRHVELLVQYWISVVVLFASHIAHHSLHTTAAHPVDKTLIYIHLIVVDRVRDS
jgi:hypothetical protein